jgi:hypothetical protein
VENQAEDYLHDCLREFPEICRKKYGVEFDLAAVEKKVKQLRRKVQLTYKDLSYFESPEHWWFKRFWIFPPESRIESELKGVTFDFWNLAPENEAEVVRQLLYIFKSIELVSIILRFVRPDNYAIFSSPNRHLLEIRPGRDPVETYLNYLRGLRQIKEHYHFARLADVDMALWVLHEKCFGTHRDPVVEAACQKDTFFLRLRTQNLVAPLAELSEAQLANALSEIKPDLAALVACHALEILIRHLAVAYGIPAQTTCAPLDEIIDLLPNFGPVNKVRKGKWKMLKDVRNGLIHEGKMPSVNERRMLIEEVLQLERDLLGQLVQAKAIEVCLP